MAQEGWSFLAHPSLLGEPFVLSSADRAIGAGEERRALKRAGSMSRPSKSRVPFADIGT
jgi:hypothetical protein